ncbi:PRC-barrel domain-containing protein [Planctobacterium marinum]|uniref:PRC-barrel domain-containing protein n=1 Tax=Planctobacterium marinum TaxID=1631968 RepID=UPI001E5E1FF0|nr:PRC-barrel domain-containing protein [Planctobacterium marinum]MCC2604930.1 PRC-barrel domain-containing protein [Planctobacterium marinum]
MALPVIDKKAETTASDAVINIQPLSVLTSSEVRNKDDQKLGKLKELMIDTKSGKTIYAVMSFGGFWGMGEKLSAIPWSAIGFNNIDKRFVLDIEVGRLKAAPSFYKDKWPNMNDINWVKKVNTFYINAKHKIAK